jgi:hypothetical protein
MKRLGQTLTFLIVVAVFSFMLYGLWLSICEKKIYSAEAAAWVQAIGTVGAIIAAFGAAYYQILKARDQAEQEKESREDRFLRSIRTELIVSRDGFLQTTGIERIPPRGNRPLVENFYFPPDQPFAIFDAVAGNILDVKNDAKRKLIIETYSKAKSVLLLLKLNNENLHVLSQAKNPNAFQTVEEPIARARLAESSSQFWERLDQTLTNIAEIERTFPQD